MRSRLVPAIFGIALFGLTPRAFAAAGPKALPATILVQLPADAKLTIDDQTTTSTSATRRFITPPLERGRIYHYTLKAEYVRGRKTITVKETVSVRAGRETGVALDFPKADGSTLESVGPSSYGAYSPGYDYGTYYDDYGTYSRSYSPLPSSSPHVAPASEGFHPIFWGTDPSDPFYLNDR